MLPSGQGSVSPAPARRAALWAGLLGFVLLSLSCGDDDPAPTGGGDDGAWVASDPILYDGSLHEPIGPFRVTDLRSKMAWTGTDSVDLYGLVENYETRDLTVYRRVGATGQPVVFFIHGGAWIDEYRHWYDFVAESFTGDRGYVTVVINYRLTSEEVFPTAICSTRTSPRPDPALKAAQYPDNLRDCADAFAWVIDHVEELGGDADNIFVFGHSAGAHLATLLATHPDYAGLRARIRGLISMSGAYRLSQLMDAVYVDILEQTFGTATDEAVLDEASPATYITPSMALPPVLVLYAEEDLPSFTAQALAFIQRLSENGAAVETEYLAGYGHVSEMKAIELPGETPTARVLDFIEDHLAED